MKERIFKIVRLKKTLSGRGYEFTQEILKSMLDDFILVSEKELLESIVIHLEKTHNLIEHAGAASLAAAIKIKDQIKGKKVALIASGGNITLSQLEFAISNYKSN